MHAVVLYHLRSAPSSRLSAVLKRGAKYSGVNLTFRNAKKGFLTPFARKITNGTNAKHETIVDEYRFLQNSPWWRRA
jgi:hypothetical protein